MPKATRTQAEPAAPPADGLSDVQRAFALEYLANGWKPGPAYRKTHPNAQPNTCYVNGWRLLRNAKVAAYVAAKLQAVWKQAEMSAEEAAARIAWDARSDAGLLVDGAGNIRPIHTLPPELRQSIKRIKRSPDGSLEVTLNDSLQARRTVLELTGKLRGGDTLRDLAELLAEKWKPADRDPGAKVAAESEE